MMMRSCETVKYSGSIDCFKYIIRQEGFRALFKGRPNVKRVGIHVPGRHIKQATIGPPGKLHLDGVSLAGRSWPEIVC